MNDDAKDYPQQRTILAFVSICLVVGVASVVSYTTKDAL